MVAASLILLYIFTAIISTTDAFFSIAPSAVVVKTAHSSSLFVRQRSTPPSSSMSLSAFPELLVGDNPLISLGAATTTTTVDNVISPLAQEARGKFWFYFLAGSGAGGIGATQVPNLFRDVASARNAAARGSIISSTSSNNKKSSSRRGSSESTINTKTKLNAGPFVKLYYNSDIDTTDLSNAIKSAPSAKDITKRSTNTNFMASRGYIVQSDFIKEMESKKCNPLASYVIFDAISGGKGGVVSPVVYDEKLASYRQEIAGGGGLDGGSSASLFVGELNSFLVVKFGAFLGLVFCLLVDFGLVAKNGIQGFLL
jgi:hypothetical protein